MVIAHKKYDQKSDEKKVVLYFHQECILESLIWKIYSKLSKFRLSRFFSMLSRARVVTKLHFFPAIATHF